MEVCKHTVTVGPAIFLNPSAYTIWNFPFENSLSPNKKWGLLRALCRIQGLVLWPWVSQHLQTFHVIVCACACKREVHTLVADQTSARLRVVWIFGLSNPHNFSTQFPLHKCLQYNCKSLALGILWVRDMTLTDGPITLAKAGKNGDRKTHSNLSVLGF